MELPLHVLVKHPLCPWIAELKRKFGLEDIYAINKKACQKDETRGLWFPG